MDAARGLVRGREALVEGERGGRALGCIRD